MLLDNPIPFGGGVRVPGHKAESLERPLSAARLPPLLTLPLRQHLGAEAQPTVAVGDYVLKGEVVAAEKGQISAAVHASSSGTVVEIGKRPVPSPSGTDALCIVIETDGKDVWAPHTGIGDDPFNLSPVEIRGKILAAGIVGLGGAGFPAAAKMLPGIHHDINLLIVNAAECEPYITCDEALIRRHAKQIVGGVELLRRAVGAFECVVAIEENKPEAIAALKKELEEIGETSIDIASLPAIYPAGGEKQLIKSLTGLEVPSQGLPMDLRVVCYNVSTTFAVYNAMAYGEPLISRVVTITGQAVHQPRNLDVLLGTPIRDLINQCGGYTEDLHQLVVGGPMMGYALKSDDRPIIKTTNCIIAATAAEMPPSATAEPCIRCGDCVKVCPAALLPQEIYWHARAKDYERAEDYSLLDCIECGCCAYVCPSNIPLVQYYRGAKTEIWKLRREHMQAENTRQRFESRQARIEQARQSGTGDDFVDAGQDQDTLRANIAAAVSRSKKKRDEGKKTDTTED